MKNFQENAQYYSIFKNITTAIVKLVELDILLL